MNSNTPRTLEFLTIGWNSLEAVLALVSGLVAGSVALMSFGFDSMIEVFSGAVLLWRLRSLSLCSSLTLKLREHTEQQALRLVVVSFVVLAIYITADSIYSLVRHRMPEGSILGIAVSAAAVVLMPLLARAKRRVARELNSEALHAESRQTDLCAYLSAITLAGLLLNSLLGWWWADPAAALVMVPIIANEAREALLEKRDCNCTH
jgi:divalent metal cation (Fe/Co/Zn/Cd) transporter